MIRIFFRLSRPYILLQLLHYSSERSDMAKTEAYGWAAGLAVGVFIDCIVSHICVQNLMHMGMKIRVACCSLLYRKILRVPITFTENETSVGQVDTMSIINFVQKRFVFSFTCKCHRFYVKWEKWLIRKWFLRNFFIIHNYNHAYWSFWSSYLKEIMFFLLKILCDKFQVLNLLSNDVSRLDHAVYYIHYIWMAPLQAVLVFYFLYNEVSLAATSGIFLQLLFLPILGKYLILCITQRQLNGKALYLIALAY